MPAKDKSGVESGSGRNSDQIRREARRHRACLRHMLRPFAADSFVLELLPARRELVVTSMNAFIGCRREGCLWARSEEEGMRVMMLTVEQLARSYVSQQ